MEHLGQKNGTIIKNKKQMIKVDVETYPALNIMGGKRYIKKRSSLKTNRCEFFPLLINKMTTPVPSPCNQIAKSLKMKH